MMGGECDGVAASSRCQCLYAVVLLLGEADRERNRVVVSCVSSLVFHSCVTQTVRLYLLASVIPLSLITPLLPFT